MHQNRDDAHFAIVVERRWRNVLIGPSLQGGKTTADDVISFQERKGHFYVNVVKLSVSTYLLPLHEFTKSLCRISVARFRLNNAAMIDVALNNYDVLLCGTKSELMKLLLDNSWWMIDVVLLLFLTLSIETMSLDIP